MIDTAELMRKVRGIRIMADKLVDDKLAGDWRSAFKGQGLEFEEIREYVPGDDVRDIDWNATARTGFPRVKRWSEERQLTVMLLVDVSASQAYGPGNRTKAELAAELSCLLALASVRSQDNVGLVLFSDKTLLALRPRKGRHAVMRIVREILSASDGAVGGGTDIAAALDCLSAVQRRRAVVFLVSDFRDEGWQRPLAVAARRHDLVCCSVADPAEFTLPDAGLVELADPESGETVWADTSSPALRAAFAKNALARAAALRSSVLAAGADLMEFSTAEDPAPVVRTFFHRRALSRKSAS